MPPPNIRVNLSAWKETLQLEFHSGMASDQGLETSAARRPSGVSGSNGAVGMRGLVGIGESHPSAWTPSTSPIRVESAALIVHG